MMDPQAAFQRAPALALIALVLHFLLTIILAAIFVETGNWWALLFALVFGYDDAQTFMEGE